MKGEATKWCDDHLPGLRLAILHERIDSYALGVESGRRDTAERAAALVPDPKSALAKRIRRLGGRKVKRNKRPSTLCPVCERIAK